MPGPRTRHVGHETPSVAPELLPKPFPRHTLPAYPCVSARSQQGLRAQGLHRKPVFSHSPRALSPRPGPPPMRPRCLQLRLPGRGKRQQAPRGISENGLLRQGPDRMKLRIGRTLPPQIRDSHQVRHPHAPDKRRSEGMEATGPLPSLEGECPLRCWVSAMQKVFPVWRCHCNNEWLAFGGAGCHWNAPPAGKGVAAGFNDVWERENFSFLRLFSFHPKVK